MASVRLEPELEARLERAARLRGESKSDFIRTALAERVEATLAASPAGRVAHLLGAVDLGGDIAGRAHEAAAELIAREHDTSQSSWPARS